MSRSTIRWYNRFESGFLLAFPTQLVLPKDDKSVVPLRRRYRNASAK
jgi:hypothetical protein